MREREHDARGGGLDAANGSATTPNHFPFIRRSSYY